MKDELAIVGLGHAHHLENVKYESSHKFYQEMFRRYTDIGLEEIEYANAGIKTNIPVVKGKYGGRKIGFYTMPFGLSYTFATDFFLDSASIKAVAGSGFCGSIRPEIEKDTVIVASEAAISSSVVCDDDWKEKMIVRKADEKLVEAMIRKAQERGYEARPGKIFTIINTAREKTSFIDELSDEGFDALEMETAVLYQIAGDYGKPVAAVLYVSDNQATHPCSNYGEIVQRLERKNKHVEMTEIARDALLETY
jgi:purine-nucleoside phosphorylase